MLDSPASAATDVVRMLELRRTLDIIPIYAVRMSGPAASSSRLLQSYLVHESNTELPARN